MCHVAGGDVIANTVPHDAERFDRIAVLCEQRQRKDIQKLNQALNEFRFLHQQPQSRREFDLYDPDALKKDRPARITDDDPRCGVSSMQKFMGEDLTRQSRNKYQREQMQDWFERQIEEREATEAAYKEANRLATFTYSACCRPFFTTPKMNSSYSLQLGGSWQI
ncbi:unnamed protein product [Dibothriocephalus latus]|uniref:RIB43A-like with coiled-coils protein 2 n=1 Tax=Dibothriocephalus latus TaxID=60516 RepID=A0A3P7L200_DIBLA|nr:unnamed protein product [Dibothriocephalus latus]